MNRSRILPVIFLTFSLAGAVGACSGLPPGPSDGAAVPSVAEEQTAKTGDPGQEAGPTLSSEAVSLKQPDPAQDTDNTPQPTLGSASTPSDTGSDGNLVFRPWPHSGLRAGPVTAGGYYGYNTHGHS